MFILPKSRRSGTRINSRIFIVITIMICITAAWRENFLLMTQMNIQISRAPIIFTATKEISFPSILSTICWCRGTNPKTFAYKPFISHTKEIRMVRILWMMNLFNLLFIIPQYAFRKFNNASFEFRWFNYFHAFAACDYPPGNFIK